MVHLEQDPKLSLGERWVWHSESESRSAVSDSLWPYGLYSPWNSPGRNTGVGSPFPSPGDLPSPGIERRSPALRADSLPAEPQGKPKNTGVGNLSLLQGDLPNPGIEWGSPALQVDSLPTELWGKPECNSQALSLMFPPCYLGWEQQGQGLGITDTVVAFWRILPVRQRCGELVTK